MENKNKNDYNNLITAILICRENGLNPRLVDSSNKVLCTVPEEVLCDVGLHKRLIDKLNPFVKTMMEWQDVTTNTVYLSIKTKNY